jgi:hypothetical protein
MCAQSNNVTVSKFIFGKKEFKKATIHFNDGTSVEGFARLKTVFTSREEVIVFKNDEKENEKIYTVKDVKGITIENEDDIREYEYLKVSKSSFPELYEVVVEGYVVLYQKTRLYDDFYTNDNNHGYYSYEQTKYYLMRDGDQFPTKIKDNYIKSLADFMKDCDSLVRKIKNHEYDYSMIKDVVNYYNDICAD